MFLWLYLILWTECSSTLFKISCDHTVSDICPAESRTTCSASCTQGCQLFARSGETSLCGWLQSFGYATEKMGVTQLEHTFNLESAVPANIVKKEPSTEDRPARMTVETVAHVLPYVQFNFIAHPQSRLVVLGLSVTFHCDAEANSSLSYQWYRSVVSNFDKTPTLPDKISEKTDSSLVIDSTSRFDNGYYLCRVEETDSRDVYFSEPAKLEILYLDTRDPIEERTRIFNSGEKVKIISCRLPDSYPAVIASWYYKRTAEDEYEMIEGAEDTFYDWHNGNLYLVNTNKQSHEGMYECRATNPYLGEGEAIVRKRIKINISGTTPTYSYDPEMIYFDTAAARTAQVGEPVTLRCAAIGNPIPEIYWTFGDDVDTLCRIPSSRYTNYDNGRKVVLHQVKLQDAEYRYECKAETQYLSKTIGALLNVGHYKVLGIHQPVTQYTPQYGGNVTLSCPVTGDLINEWYRNGEFLTSRKGEYYERNNTINALEVTGSTRSHGVYTCLSLSQYGGLVLKNLHTTMPVLSVTVHLYLDLTQYNNVESQSFDRNSVEGVTTTARYITCVASGFPPPRLYWYMNGELIVDSSRFSFSFDKTDSTIINTTLNISNLATQTEIRCMAVSQTEAYVERAYDTYVLYPEGERIERVENVNMYYIIIVACVVMVALVLCILFLSFKFKKERLNTKPMRTYMDTLQQIQRDGGLEVDSKALLREEYKYAAHLHDILKTMQIKDEGDIESFRDIIQDWVNEDLQGGDDSDFARRFRESFISKRSMGRGFNSSNRYGNQFRLDLNKNAEKKESNLLDETPERDSFIPLGKSVSSIGQSRRASNPIYAPLPETPGGGETEIDCLRDTAL